MDKNKKLAEVLKKAEDDGVFKGRKTAWGYTKTGRMYLMDYDTKEKLSEEVENPFSTPEQFSAMQKVLKLLKNDKDGSFRARLRALSTHGRKDKDA